MAKIHVNYHEIENIDMTGVIIDVIHPDGVTTESFTNFAEYTEQKTELWSNQTDSFDIPDEAVPLVIAIIEANPQYEKRKTNEV